MIKKIFHLLFLLTFLPVVSQEYERISSDSIVEIEPGKPVILVVSVFGKNAENKWPLLAKREQNELKKNFPDCDIRLIDFRCRIHFLNNAREKTVFTNEKTTYEHVIYWDGKKSSAIKTSPIRTKLTEYVSSVTGKKNISSYLADNQKIFDTIAQRKKLFNPDNGSKYLAQFYSLNLLYNQRLYGELWFPSLSKQDFGKVKSATVYMSRSDQPEAEAFQINFNEQHLVSNISYVKRPGNANTVFFIFSYDNNGLLRKMVSTDDFEGQARAHVYEYTYDGNLMIETSEDQISEVYLKNDLLLESRHYEFADYDKTFLIENSQTVMEDLCKVTYTNGLKDESYCVSGFGTETPFTYEKILFDNGQPARVSTSKIDRDANRLIISNQSHGEFRQTASIKLNKSGLVEEVDGGQSKGITYHLRVDYAYFD